MPKKLAKITQLGGNKVETQFCLIPKFTLFHPLRVLAFLPAKLDCPTPSKPIEATVGK